MAIYLGLGSNTGDRRGHLRQALTQLPIHGVQLLRLSPVLETSALLPADALADWNLPFLNLVAECAFAGSPQALRAVCKRIQQALNPTATASRWAPRPIDIDILLWHHDSIRDAELAIPKPDLQRRAFELSPLVHLQPNLIIPEAGCETVLAWSQALAHHIPLWMGIINITPDSFSDGGRFTDWAAIEPQLEAMVSAGVHIVDLGAESTRPGASPLNHDQEWRRLQPALERVLEKFQGDPLRPRLSIDTYHPETAARALAKGVDMINDVGGLNAPEMLALARASGRDKDWVAMHQLGVPADSRATLPVGDPYVEVERWLLRQLATWQQNGLDLNRIIFDPGIGFGKDGLQSLHLLRRAGEFRRHGLRVLVGHSRKSFMRHFSTLEPADKDWVTVGAALALCAQRVDIIRVHNVPAHIAAYRGWSHVQLP